MSLLIPFSSTLIPDVFLLLISSVVLVMYITLKREITTQAKRNRRVEAMLMRLQEASTAPAAAQRAGHLPPEERQEFPAPVPVSLRPAMNVSRRVQALRLMRRGEDTGNIASALGVPRCEIELLMRVHRLTMAARAGGNSGAAAAVE